MIPAGVAAAAPCDNTAPVAAVKNSPFASAPAVAYPIVDNAPVVGLVTTNACLSVSYVTVAKMVDVIATAVAWVDVAFCEIVTVPVPAVVVYVPNAVIVDPVGTPVMTIVSPTASEPEVVDTIVTVGELATHVAVPTNLLPVVCSAV